MPYKINDIESILQRLLDYFNLDNMSQLADKLSISQPTISKWKSRGSILPIKKKCRKLGIYNEIFSDSKISNKEAEDKTTNDLSKYFIALQSVASATNKEDELIEDIKILMKKHIG